MPTTMLSPNVERACALWEEYQKDHDVADRVGQTVGIDSATGRIWFGESALDIVRQMDAENAFTPLYYVRVGYEFYERKGGRL